MKKRLLTLATALLALTMVLSACGGGGGTTAPEPAPAGSGEPAATPEPAPSGEKETITVWTKDRHDQEFMMEIVNKLNAEYDDMEVVYEMYTDNYPNTIEIAASTGELPDIICLTDQVVDSILARDMFYYMDDLMPEGYLDRFDKSLFIEGINMKDGKVFSMPNTGTALRLVYNQDIFDRVGIDGPPTSIDEMVEYAQKITNELSGEGIYGFALPMKNPTSGFRRGFMSMEQLSGYPVFEGFDYSKGEFDFSCYKPALDALREIFTSGAAFPGCEALDIDPLRTQFAEGKIGMYMTYNHSEWGVYTSQFPSDEHWQYAVLPTYEGKIEGAQRLSAGTWYGITTNTKAPEKAWRVIEAFYDINNQVASYEQGLGVTVLKDVQETAKLPESIEYTPAMAILDSDKIYPVGPRNLTIEGDDWGTMFGAYVFGQLSDLDGMVEDLNERYNESYEKSVADGTNPEIHYPNFKASDPAGTAN